DQAQQGGLAGAVGAQQTQHATRLQTQRHIIESDLAVLIDLGELERLDHQVAGTVGHEAPSSTETINAGLYDEGILLPRATKSGREFIHLRLTQRKLVERKRISKMRI